MNKLILIAACVWQLLLASAYAAQPERPVDSIAQRVTACTTCHGKEGRATNEGYFPRIAGKPAGYLYNQLVNFRDGRRNYPLMVYLVEHLTDEYLNEIAQYFARLDLPYPQPQAVSAPETLLARGEALVQRGDRSRKIPACVQCHGQHLLGANPAIPGLLGLSRDYIYGQLGLWKTGERRAHAPDCMAQIASQLTPEDIRAASAWLAAQAVPPGAKAATAPGAPLPLACGSVPK